MVSQKKACLIAGAEAAEPGDEQPEPEGEPELGDEVGSGDARKWGARTETVGEAGSEGVRTEACPGSSLRRLDELGAADIL